MKHIIPFLLKSNAYFLFITLVFSLIAIQLGGVWKFIPYILLLFFCYEWNVSSKTANNWSFLETLPLSFFHRYILRVLFPFIFCFSIFFLLENFNQTVLVGTFSSFAEAFRQSFVFVLSSLIGGGLGSFLFWILLLNAFLFFIVSFHFYLPCLIFFFFTYSYYVLSKGRCSKQKFLFLPSILFIVCLFFGSSLELSSYKFLLSIPVEFIQRYSANQLVMQNAFVENHAYRYSFIENRNFFTIDRDPELNEPLLKKIESVLVKGEKCDHNCLQLARIVQNYPDYWSQENLSDLLNSSEHGKQIYALEVILYSDRIVFFNRIFQLSQSDNMDVSNRALVILNHWGIHSFHDLPTTEPM
jgi:hypothetical protein